MNRLQICSLVFLIGSIAISRADSAEIPSQAPFDLSTGATNGTTVSTADEGISIVFNPKTGFPNVTWSAPTTWDWSAATQLAVVVTNTGSSPTQLYFITKDAAGKNLYTGFSGPTLEAGKTYTLLTDLTKDSANDCKSHYGMNFPPPAVTGENVWLNDQHGAIDLTKVASLEIFMQEAPAEPVTVNVKSIKLYTPATLQALYEGIIDPFGQFTQATWPAKITNASDFASRLADENKDLAAHPNLPDRDEYGAWTGGEKVSPAPGFFQTTQRDGKWWLVAPNGNLFLSFGFNGLWPGGNPPPASTMDSATVTKGREYMFQSIPQDVHTSTSYFQYGPFKSSGVPTYDFYGANIDHKYGTNYGSGDFLPAWNAQTLKRMQSWGFNTIANWSDNRPESLQAQDKLAYTVTLSSKSPSKVGRDRVPDPYDPGFALETEKIFQKTITTQIASDPWCLGYYCDNEIRWSQSYPEWGPKLITTQNRYTLAIATLASEATQPAKAAFRDQMQTQYQTIDQLNTAWGTRFASWDAFLQPYTVPANPPAALITDMGSFTRAYAAKYATTIKSLIKKYDPNHLYLGCRFSFSSPEVIKGVAADGGCDVVSFNIYAYTLEPALWEFTNDLKKPCIVSEYHFGAQGDGIFGYGNGTACRTVNQQDRAQKFVAYTQSLLAQPAFVGAHWFQLTDEPVTGRFYDGENYNIGFVDVGDTPYPLMVDAARSIYAQAYTLHQAAAPAITQK